MVTVNVLVFMFSIYLSTNQMGILIFTLLASLNRNVIVNSPNLNKSEKLTIYSSFLLMAGLLIYYNLYLINVVWK